MSKTIKKNAIVTQSNKLIKARYYLSLTEQKIIWALCSCIQPEDDDFKEYEFKIKNLAKILNIDEKIAYQQIKKATYDLIGRIIQIKKPKGLLQISWLSSSEYFDKKGIIKLKFDSKLKPYLLKLKERFTQIKIEQLMSFNSIYSGRLYEIIKSLYNEKSINNPVELNELKKMLNIEKEKAYSAYGHISYRILKPGIKEINKKTDLLISFIPIKIGRKVTSIQFIVDKKKGKLINSIKKKDATLDKVTSKTKKIRNSQLLIKSLRKKYKI